MATKTVTVRCPFCGSEKIAKNGHNSTGKQVYRCSNSACPRKSFVEEYTYKACKPEVRRQVLRLAVDCTGMRATGQILGISKDSVTAILKKTADWICQVNSDHIQEHRVNGVDLVSAEQVDVEEAEMDGMWSFVHDKSQQYWLWWAIDHQTGVPLAYCFGTREHRNLDELRTLLEPFPIRTVYADGNYAYKSRITENTVVTGKKNTQRIERRHLSLRTWCSRLVRKTLRFSKLHRMHDIVVGLVINCRLFARAFLFHLI